MAQTEKKVINKKVNKKTNTKWKIAKYFVLWIILVFTGIKVRDTVLGWISGNLILNPLFSFREVHNTGAAFNLFPNSASALILTGIICTLIITLFVILKPLKLSQQMISAMTLLSSGMTLNTIERIQYGYVIDYIYLTFFDTFPVFNLADIMIVTGALMLAGALIFKSRDNK